MNRKGKKIRKSKPTVHYKQKGKNKSKIEFDTKELDEDILEDGGYLSDEEVEKLKEEFKTEALPHIGVLHTYALRLTGNELDADDLLQETYMRAYRFFHKFEKGTNCKAWLFRIMKNLFINNYRKNQKLPNKVDYDDIENYYESIRSEKINTTDLQERIYSSLLDDQVTNALNSLQDDFKTVIILCDLEGLSYEEIAEFVNCPVGTVRSRLHRGRKLLAQKLKKYAEEKGYDVENAFA
ncbi:MAG: sigma-70 family RNA polymerase sigma factor [Ignavibacteria bacterium]